MQEGYKRDGSFDWVVSTDKLKHLEGLQRLRSHSVQEGYKSNVGFDGAHPAGPLRKFSDPPAGPSNQVRSTQTSAPRALRVSERSGVSGPSGVSLVSGVSFRKTNIPVTTIQHAIQYTKRPARNIIPHTPQHLRNPLSPPLGSTGRHSGPPHHIGFKMTSAINIYLLYLLFISAALSIFCLCCCRGRCVLCKKGRCQSYSRYKGQKSPIRVENLSLGGWVSSATIQ